jgi:catechol 2,3-dioxygenase-like lactoylglutathione lyase family enzyme
LAARFAASVAIRRRIELKIEQIDHVALTVKDQARSIDWYHDVLGLERRHAGVWGDVPAMMCAGETCVALFRAYSPEPNAPPDHNTIAMRHLAFKVDRANFEQAQQELKARGIEFEFQDHMISHSIYFNDPDGHQIELTTYDVE